MDNLKFKLEDRIVYTDEGYHFRYATEEEIKRCKRRDI